MFRILFVTFICVVTSTVALSQPIHRVETSVGATYQGTGDILARSIIIQYARQIHPIIEVGLQYENAGGSYAKASGKFASTQINAIDMLVGVHPFGKNHTWFTLRLGPSLRKVNQFEGFGYSKMDDLSSTTIGFGGPPTFINDRAIGLALNLDLRLLNREHMDMGLRAISRPYYTNCDVENGMLIFFGFKL